MAKSIRKQTGKACFIINDLETLRVFSDPLRSKIYEMLIDEPLTIRQVAGKLGLASSKLYYHVNLMEQAKLIKVVETRMVANLEEKIYQAAAPCLEISPALLNFSKDKNFEGAAQLVSSILDSTREDMIRSIQARQASLEQGAEPHNRRAIISREVRSLTPEKQKEFEDRLDALMHDFDGLDQKGPADDRQSYTMTVAFYPNFYFPEEKPA